MPGDGVAVCGSSEQGAEDKEIERSLQQLYLRRCIRPRHCVDILLIFCRVSTINPEKFEVD